MGLLDLACPYPICRRYDMAYLHHRAKAEVALGLMLLTEHNLWRYQELMRAIRAAIAEGRFAAFRAELEARWAG